MTIGRPQGNAWIGKPLDMVIPLTLDEAEGGGSLCLEAEVLQGDTRIDDKRVTVSLEPGATPGSSRAHVRSTVQIEEPVVTVTLRAGCDTKSTRRFVLFADVPAVAPPVASAPLPPARAGEGSEPPLPAAPPAPARTVDATPAGEGPGTGDGEVILQPPPRRVPSAPRASPVPSAEAPSRPPVAAAPARPRVAATAPVVRPPAPAPAPRVAAPLPDPKPAPAPPPVPRGTGAAGGSRLQIDALEPAPAAREGELKSSQALALPAAEDPAKRSDAAAAWRSIAGASEETQRESQRLQALETALSALHEMTAQNQSTLLALRSELTEARETRYRNPLVFALLGLLLLTLLALALMWRALRRATAPAWWGEGPQPGKTRYAPPGSHDRQPDPDRKQPAEPDWIAPGSTFAPLEPEQEEDSVDPPSATPVSNLLAHPAQRLVNTEELFDVQQQSDFFLSLGQHDQAIDVLREHIAAHPDTSALAFLDLLKIYHSRGRREEYDRLRQDFLRRFNAEVPQFEHFEQSGRGLEHYRGALARIEAQWPAPGTLPLIEELVFRKPGKHAEDSFDLAAYRELLLLYSIAREVIDPNNVPPAPVTPLSFVDTNVQAQLTTAPAPLRSHATPAIATAANFAFNTEPPLEDTASAALEAGQTRPASLFGATDNSLQDQTVIAPEVPEVQRSEPPPRRPGREMDFTEVDRTAYETLPTPLDDPALSPPPASPAPLPQADPQSVDFELFDPDTEFDIAPRKLPKDS